MIEKCTLCTGELSFDKISNCKRCRVCHPIEPLPKPPISFSLIGLEYCDTDEERATRIEEVARESGWNPEEYVREENLRRYGIL